ncbi:hypothetical protein SSX86_027414 [Deinandra increscens subsp. villosa]|uniref:Uncharacterized protein n=1 Tax=Deinandra increscens subsp. villosa TaxID=3103831 RepID=A0AAP0GQ57_9ASTR
MGCCASTNKHHPSSKFRRHSSTSSRAPPPIDVETVKEVLSETPNIKIENIDPKKHSSRYHSYKFPPQDHVIEDPIIISESENISTTTFEDDENDVYRRKVISRSPAKSGSRKQVSGELQPVRKSPVRVKELSPGRVKLVPERNGRETGFGCSVRQRPGSGNLSAARSRSPAKRTAAGGGNGIGRSLSCRKTGKSPSRVGSDLHERIRKPEVRSGREREHRSTFPTATNNDESLENPLVSLECFIFL